MTVVLPCSPVLSRDLRLSRAVTILYCSDVTVTRSVMNLLHIVMRLKRLESDSLVKCRLKVRSQHWRFICSPTEYKFCYGY